MFRNNMKELSYCKEHQPKFGKMAIVSLNVSGSLTDSIFHCAKCDERKKV